MSDPTKAAGAALAVWLGVVLVGLPTPASAKAAHKAAHRAPKTQPASETVAQLAQWVMASDDHGDMPFVIIDKVAARIFVFDAEGRLLGAAAALLGSAKGDNSAPGVGDREVADIPMNQRTTPAGRFVASYGTAAGASRVLWVDYPTAISLHAVVTNHPEERRLQRLASPTPRDNRITHGCINVSAAFYEKVVRPTFTHTSGIVYILPERKSLAEVFPAFHAQANTGLPADASAGGESSRPGHANGRSDDHDE
jgi:hypothetical protein